MGNRTRLILALLLGLIALSVADGATDSSRVISASKVLATIKAGEPAEFDNCIIVGDLNFSTLEIDEPVHFNHTLFQNSVDFSLTTFNGTAAFQFSTFNGYANFWSSTFKGNAAFQGSTFNGDAAFQSSTFKGTAAFQGSTFNGYTNFQFSTFNGWASFWSSTFNGYANFQGSTFKGDAFFQSSTFNGTAYLKDTRFNTTDFTATQFNKEASFDDTQFKGIASFYNSRFKDDALFENTTFKDKLSLARTRYDKLYIRWSDITKGIIYDDAAYMSLMKNFKDLGYFEDYDSCYFQYRKEHRDQSWPLVSSWDKPIRKCIDFFLEWFYGYGTKPFNALYISIAIIIVFGIFWKAIGFGGPDDTTGKDIEGWEKPHGILDILSFSITIFLSGTKLFIDPPAIPMIKGRSKSMVKKAFTFERILGALFSILFFLAISGTVVR